jgi:hypothetical protein
MIMLPHAFGDHRRTAHNVNFYVARRFTLRRKFVRSIFTFNPQQKYLLMWTTLNIVALSRNKYCHGNATILSVCFVVDLYVAVNNVKLFFVAT